MNKVRKFDEIVRKKEAQQFMMTRVLLVIFLGMGGMMMLMPFDMEEWKMLTIFPLYLLGMALTFYLQPYMYIKEGQKLTSIYKLLKFMPVTAQDIFRVRREYVNRFCKRILAAYIICQVILAVLLKEFTIFTILYPVAVTAVLWIWGILYIKEWGKN